MVVDFEKYLKREELSKNTRASYIGALKKYNDLLGEEITKKNY